MKLYLVCFFALALFIDYSSSATQTPPPEPAQTKASSSASDGTEQLNDALKIPKDYQITVKTQYEAHAVKFFSNKVTWNDARKACFHEKHGAFLAYATSKEEEQIFVKTMQKNKVNDLWVGIHDLFDLGSNDFSTIGGEIAKEVAYINWLPGEPNDYNGTEPCVQYRTKQGKTGLNDRKCSVKFAYMCKIKRHLPQM